MKKSSMIVTMMGTVGGLLLAIGMCGCLVPELSMFGIGIGLGIVGILVLLAIWPVYNKVEHKEPVKVSKKVIMTAILGVLGLGALGVGLSICLLKTSTMLIPGIFIGAVGIVICVVSILVSVGIKE